MLNSLRTIAFLLGTGVILLAVRQARAGEPAGDWQRVVELDAGPKGSPNTQQEARAVAVAHLGKQEKALRDFLSLHPRDSHAFEGEMRLARLLQIRAGLENAEGPRQEARRLLDKLYSTATADQRVEVDFARITYQMRGMKSGGRTEREQLLSAARRFQAEHPSDRRLPALLAEIAGMFDSEPETKRSLLMSVQSIAQDEELKHRVADDLRRLDWLGKEIPLQCTTTGGKTIKLEESRGKVVLLIFFADWSPPSLEAIAKVQRALEPIPKNALDVLGISLDNKGEELANSISKNGINFPVGFDGKGWASPLVRALGINTLPTVWLIDQQGRLRSLNGTEGTTDQIWHLIRKPPAPE